MISSTQSALLRLLTPLVILALLASALIVTRTVVAQPGAPEVLPVSPRDYYYNLAPPRMLSDVSKDVKVGKGRDVGSERYGPLGNLAKWWEGQQRKGANGFPRAARQLAKLEAQAQATGRNPRDIKGAAAGGAQGDVQVAQLLTVLTEFDPNADDDFSGFERIVDINGVTGEDCVTEPAGTLLGGPLHNNLGNPAAFGLDGTPDTIDNNTFWVPNFSASHYRKMLFTDDGITQRVRKDLTGPDGLPGIDIAGYTLKSMYEEMSKGAYTIDGDIAGWVELAHSEGYYGADSCAAGVSSDVGHPDNERGASQLVVDAVDAIAAADPSFPWESYDVEDQGDLDDDGNLFEPDGVIDHFVLVHAGSGEEGGGGDQGTYAIWSHSSVVDPADGGYTIPGTDLKVFNYIVQPEDAGVGVFAHEYGHDLGLPDLYDTSGGGDSDVEFWDLMSTGSHSGPIFQAIPAHMGLWDKFVLGWVDPVVFDVGDGTEAVRVGQTSNTPKGSEHGIRVNLPDKEVNLAEPHSGTQMWWGNNDQNWADVKLARSIEVPAGTDVRFWLWNNYVIEELWDYGFIEVSTDGGTSWAQLEVFDDTDTMVSTDEDPNGNLVNFGGLENGLTGDSGGWRHDYVDLTPYAEDTILLRLRHATDGGFLERGWFADDFSVTADGTTVWSDDVESGLSGWTAELGTFAGTTGAGWIMTDGHFTFAQYYLVEWRNFNGFDRGLRYTYDSDYLRLDTGEWAVKRVPYNAPGMIIYYRDIQYGGVNHVTSNTFALPSTGSKGGLLIVDSHFDPYRRRGEAADQDPTLLNNIQSRPQAANAAFTTQKTYRFTECLEMPDGSYDLYCTKFDRQPGIAKFDDSLGYYPGLEDRGDNGLFFRDVDASVVISSRGNAPYSTRFVDRHGDLIPEGFEFDLGDGIILGTGNPGDGLFVDSDPEDLSWGVTFTIKKVADNNSWAKIRVNPAD